MVESLIRLAGVTTPYASCINPMDELVHLSVFAGGWSLEAAKSVAGRDTKEGAVLDLLSALVEKSLVVSERDGKCGRRYRMLEPVRQYALEDLEESGEIEEIGRRHAAFFLALAQEAEPQLRGQEQAGDGEARSEHRAMSRTGRRPDAGLRT